MHDRPPEDIGPRVENGLQIAVAHLRGGQCRGHAEHRVPVANAVNGTDGAGKARIGDLRHALGLEVEQRGVGGHESDGGVARGAVRAVVRTTAAGGRCGAFLGLGLHQVELVAELKEEAIGEAGARVER